MGAVAVRPRADRDAALAAAQVTLFPKPRGIGRDWEPAAIVTERLPALLAGDILFEAATDGRGAIVEARAWRIVRGKGRGSLRRIDMAFADGSQASLRILARAYTLRIGEEPCR